MTGEISRITGPGIDGGREIVFWYERSPVAIRSGKWKWLRAGFWNTSPALYDLAADPGEANDLRRTRPDLAQQLDNRIDQLVNGG
jgi:arylsulfatase A-like enzyme